MNVINWIQSLFSNDIKKLRQEESRNFLLASIGYANLGGVDPWDCIPAVEGHEAILSLFRVIGASKGWIADVEKRLKFVKMTEHLIGYHFAIGDPRPKRMKDDVYQEWLNNMDGLFLNKIWRLLTNRRPADTIPSREEIALRCWPKPQDPRFANNDRSKGSRKAFQDFLGDVFYTKLENEFATIR